MKTYAEFSPSVGAARGLGLPDRQNWLVAPVTTNRDADCLQRSNWEVVTRDLQGFGVDAGEDNPSVEIHRFGHWACGWFEICLVRPGSPAEVKAGGWEDCLSDYPVASDSHFSDLEWTETADYWARMGLSERRLECERARVSKLEAYRPLGKVSDRLFEALRES